MFFVFMFSCLRDRKDIKEPWDPKRVYGVCVGVTGLNLPVGDVIKAPHTAGSDGGTAAVAAEEGININQACIKETALQSQPDLHPNN